MSNTRIFVGKEILRLITTAMYDNPLTAYREYIQNAVDAIDSVAEKGTDKGNSKIHITLNQGERSIIIYDNGPGVPAVKFSNHMKTIGRSEKIGASLRGLWGIGRLAGLAYCKHLAFRTKAPGENKISRIDWDGQKFREILSDPDKTTDLSEIIERITTISSDPVNVEQPSFFEVKLNQVVRHGNDVLLNEKMVSEYLAQVAPVPFHVDAPFRKQIQKFMTPHIDVSGYRIYLNEMPEPIYKPHQKKFIYSANHEDCFSDVECFEVKGRENKSVIVGWILHHSYLGALKNNPMMRGIRVRSGNMQIGNERILSRIFPEERFNSWSVGELHILDHKLRPNGQRSDMEDTPAFREIRSKLVPIIGRKIARKCRTHSSARNKFRLILERLKAIDVSLDILEANILSSAKANSLLVDIEQEITNYRRDLITLSSLSQECLSVDTDQRLIRLQKIQNLNYEPPRLKNLPKVQRDLVKNIADLVYDHSPNPKIAGELIFYIGSFIEGN